MRGTAKYQQAETAHQMAIAKQQIRPKIGVSCHFRKSAVHALDIVLRECVGLSIVHFKQQGRKRGGVIERGLAQFNRRWRGRHDVITFNMDGLRA